METDIIPFFTSDYTLGRSILQIEKSKEIKENAPVSILAIAAKHKLDPVFIIENTPAGFIKTYKYFKEANIQFVFGLQLVVVHDINNRSEESISNESKVIILLKNTDAYFDMIKIYSQAATVGKYYYPRTSWTELKNKWTKNLQLLIPFYDSFIHANLLQNKICIPEFPEEPTFCLGDHNLPFDQLINPVLKNYYTHNGGKTINTHSCYYYKKSDFLAYQVFRCIHDRTTLEKPELKQFSSDTFSFEDFLIKTGRTI